MTIDRSWTLLDPEGSSVINFTSFIAVNIESSGDALSNPIEEGSFVTYNKVEKPIEIRVSLATQGTEEEFGSILNKLDEFKREAKKIMVGTPAKVYSSMTLTAYSYSRRADAGAGMLAVDLQLVEVKEVTTNVTTTVITKPKNPTSANIIHTGTMKTIPADPKELETKTPNGQSVFGNSMR